MKTKATPHPKPGKRKKKKSEHELSYHGLMKRYADVVLRDGGKCSNPRCDCPNPFTIDYPHHIKKKSQGRDDRAINLITLGVHCHDKIHGRGTLKITGAYPNLTFHYPGGETTKYPERF